MGKLYKLTTGEQIQDIEKSFQAFKTAKSKQNEGDNMSEDSKYIDQRFENVDLKLKLLDERADSKFNLLCEKMDNVATIVSGIKTDLDSTKVGFETSLKDTTTSLREDMKSVQASVKEDVKNVLNDGKNTRKTIVTTAIASIIALFVGLGGILFMINQLQNSWFQENLSVHSQAIDTILSNIQKDPSAKK